MGSKSRDSWVHKAEKAPVSGSHSAAWTIPSIRPVERNAQFAYPAQRSSVIARDEKSADRQTKVPGA